MNLADQWREICSDPDVDELSMIVLLSTLDGQARLELVQNKDNFNIHFKIVFSDKSEWTSWKMNQ